MMKKERQHRIALVILVSAVVFCIMLVAVFLAGIVVNIALNAGMLLDSSGRPRTQPLVTLMGAVSLIIGIMITALISRISLKPVNRVINQMNRLAAGDFKARLHFGEPINAHPTFVEISDSFNKMAQELENTEMLRSDFINNFSHEFKTPIVSIAGFAKLLRRGDLTMEQRAEYLRIIEEEALRLSAMATNVLNLTRCENQTILTDITAFNLSEQIRSSILSLEGKWSKKKIEFDLDFEELTIEANKDLLKNIWINLIDNAIKFSSVGGRVAIDAKLKNGIITVTVTNTGSEISPEQQKRIFNKFYQADESHASEGNGIGLALAKGVVELHGGAISVVSQNNTTAFTVELSQNQKIIDVEK